MTLKKNQEYTIVWPLLEMEKFIEPEYYFKKKFIFDTHVLVQGF